MNTYERAPLSEIIDKHNIKSIHPAADLFPMYSDEDFQLACQDVAASGFIQSVKVTRDRVLLDGRNRLQVGYALEMDPVIEVISPIDPIAYIFSLNIVRRDLTPGQKAAIADGLRNLKNGERGPTRVANGEEKAEHACSACCSARVSRADAAEKVGVSSKAVAMAGVIREFAPAEHKLLQCGKISLDEAYRIASRNKKEAEKREKPEASKPKQPMIKLAGIVDKSPVLISYPAPQGKHQFNRTNQAVDWASWTWNPVTGCLHGCPYCYAREMAYRDSYKASYPIKFAPLFHHERLDDPVNTVPGTSRPQDGRVFVCSMADLFGEWVPQEWIDKVFEATLRAPQWEYLFLTKFPRRYRRINLPPKAWFGASVDTQKRVKTVEEHMPQLDVAVRWLSVEPMLEPIQFNDLSWCDLLVIGAQSETNQPHGYVPAFRPKFEWVCALVAQARSFDVPVYLKPNLNGLSTGSDPGMDLPREQPRRRQRPTAPGLTAGRFCLSNE